MLHLLHIKIIAMPVSDFLSGKELMIKPFSDASFLTLSSKKAFQTQGEWELLSINISKGTILTIQEEQDQLIYTVQSGAIRIRSF